MDEYEFLNTIKSPADLKGMSNSDLEKLCSEIRSKLIYVVSRNGGHLASNLGVVELTVALDKVFNSVDDDIVWDVGHQCYTHKILTGRLDKMHTIRKEGGLSGFPKRKESTQIQESAWEITVARAAPRTPMWKPKMNTGSRMMLATAPMRTESIPVFAKPWAVMKLFMPSVSCTKIVPIA